MWRARGALAVPRPSFTSRSNCLLHIAEADIAGELLVGPHSTKFRIKAVPR